jgi:hypothetical protein
LDVYEVVPVVAEKPSDDSAHSGGLVQAGLDWAASKDTRAETAKHRRWIIWYGDNFITVLFDFLLTFRRARRTRIANQGDLMMNAQESELVISPELVAAQRRIGEPWGNEENSHSTWVGGNLEIQVVNNQRCRKTQARAAHLLRRTNRARNKLSWRLGPGER